MVSLTVEAQPVFDAMYFVRGSVARNGAPNPVDGRTVVFYESYPAGVRSTVAAGEYLINIFDEETFRPVEGRTYQVAVEQGLDGWGADPVDIALTRDGWNLADLTLTAGGGPGGTTEGPDDGLINGSTITRQDDGQIRLDWAYNGALNAVIWRMEADPDTDEFSDDTGGYSQVAGTFTLAAGETTWTDPDTSTGDGRTFYYRIVPDEVLQADIFGVSGGTAYNGRTLGKLDKTLGEEYNAVCYPFNSAYIDIPTLVGNQLVVGDQIHWWDWGEQEYVMSTKIPDPGRVWSQVHNFEFAEGFMIYIVRGEELDPPVPPRSIELTLVGLVGNFAPGIEIDLGREYNFIGYPYPVVNDAAGINLIPAGEDQIHYWNHGTQKFEMTNYIGGWMIPELTEFSVGEGKFFYDPPEDAETDIWAPSF